MATAKNLRMSGNPQIVGSFGSSLDLRTSVVAVVLEACDIAEIRLDLLEPEDLTTQLLPWSHLAGIPLLFTARRTEEGGARALDAAVRSRLLKTALPHAAWIDVEVASIDEMSGLLAELPELQIPWIASYHDFNERPPTAVLAQAAKKAKDAGATIFKAAAQLRSPADLARLAEFQLADHGIPVATMGMGPLAPVSRLLCAQCGSLLNYGYLGTTATAPGQWDSTLLKQAVSRLIPINSRF